MNAQAIELRELRRVKDELVGLARRTMAAGEEPLPRLARGMMLASIELYVAHVGEAATAGWMRELAASIDAASNGGDRHA